MPDWLRDVFLAVAAFIGGRAVNGISEQMREGRELRRGVDRLTTAVENIGSDLRSIRSEIHSQVSGLKVEIHEQVSSLRDELHAHQAQQESRLGNIEERIDLTGARIDALSAGAGFFTGPPPRGRARLDMERSCYRPAGEEPGE